MIQDVLNGFWASLPQSDRYLFLRRYYHMDSCKEIAKLKDIVSEYTLEEKKAEYHDYVEKVWGDENSMG